MGVCLSVLLVVVVCRESKKRKEGDEMPVGIAPTPYTLVAPGDRHFSLGKRVRTEVYDSTITQQARAHEVPLNGLVACGASSVSQPLLPDFSVSLVAVPICCLAGFRTIVLFTATSTTHHRAELKHIRTDCTFIVAA